MNWEEWVSISGIAGFVLIIVEPFSQILEEKLGDWITALLKLVLSVALAFIAVAGIGDYSVRAWVSAIFIGLSAFGLATGASEAAHGLYWRGRP